MEHEHHPPASRGDVAYETFYSAAIGGAVPALYFLMVDVLAGQPLATPSTLGSALFMGVAPGTAETVNLTAVSLYSLVHFATFGILGFVASGLVRTLEERSGGGFVLPALALFVMVTGGMWVADLTVMNGVVAALGQGNLMISGALTSLVMTGFLRHAHDSSEGLTRKGGAKSGVSVVV